MSNNFDATYLIPSTLCITQGTHNTLISLCIQSVSVILHTQIQQHHHAMNTTVSSFKVHDFVTT